MYKCGIGKRGWWPLAEAALQTSRHELRLHSKHQDTNITHRANTVLLWSRDKLSFIRYCVPHFFIITGILVSDWHSVFCLWIQVGLYTVWKMATTFFTLQCQVSHFNTPNHFPRFPSCITLLRGRTRKQDKHTSICKSNDWIIIKL